MSNMLVILLFMVLVSLIYILFIFISLKQEKEIMFLSCYECGFEPMSLARKNFSYRFFLLAILFLVFDVEIILFLVTPFIMMKLKSYLMMFLFMMLLILGLLYEWNWGSLNWL